MKERSTSILQAIIKSFITTSQPVGSRFLQESCAFSCSSATIRNEMGKLEEEGYIHSPHASAGRIPTEKGFRFFVENHDDEITQRRPDIKKECAHQFKKYFEEKKADEMIYDVVSVLTNLTPNVVFATIPSSERMFFLGFSNILRQPEFSEHPDIASGIFRVLETNFHTVLSTLDVTDEPRVFIGSENILSEIQSCSLVVLSCSHHGHNQYIGILGPMRMDYTRNIIALESAQLFLNSQKS